MLYSRRMVIGLVALAMAFSAVAVANGDVLRDRDRDQLRTKDCVAAIQDRVRDCDEVCVPDGDGVPDQDQDRTRDRDRLHIV